MLWVRGRKEAALTRFVHDIKPHGGRLEVRPLYRVWVGGRLKLIPAPLTGESSESKTVVEHPVFFSSVAVPVAVAARKRKHGGHGESYCLKELNLWKSTE